jgi:hypothetical protein
VFSTSRGLAGIHNSATLLAFSPWLERTTLNILQRVVVYLKHDGGVCRWPPLAVRR